MNPYQPPVEIDGRAKRARLNARRRQWPLVESIVFWGLVGVVLSFALLLLLPTLMETLTIIFTYFNS